MSCSTANDHRSGRILKHVYGRLMKPLNEGLLLLAPVFILIAAVGYARAQAPQKQAPISNAASPQAVCSFITERMDSAIPQVPTLCSGKQDLVPGYYDVNIFSPQDVLEGNMRRAWSSALFQALEDVVNAKSLKGACARTPICNVTITDAYMEQRFWRYRLFLTQDMFAGIRSETDAFSGSEFSEPWYLAWWDTLLISKESDYPRSRENATSLGNAACNKYVASTHQDREGWRSSLQPSCSIILATDKSLYIAVTFQNLVDAVVINNVAALPESFGEELEATGYDGQVIIKSQWWTTAHGDQERISKIYPMRDLEFVYDEAMSGLRSEAEVSILLSSRYEVEGQTSASHLRSADDRKDELLLREAGVVTYVRGPERTTLKTTDGAQWSVRSEYFDKCGIVVGSEVSVVIDGDDDPPMTPLPGATRERRVSVSLHKDGKACDLDAVFMKGW